MRDGEDLDVLERRRPPRAGAILRRPAPVVDRQRCVVTAYRVRDECAVERELADPGATPTDPRAERLRGLTALLLRYLDSNGLVVTAQSLAALCSIKPRSAALCSRFPQRRAAPCSTMQHLAAPCSTLQHCAAADLLGDFAFHHRLGDDGNGARRAGACTSQGIPDGSRGETSRWRRHHLAASDAHIDAD